MSFKDMLKQAEGQQQDSQTNTRQTQGGGRQKADEVARDIGRHADDGVRTNTPEQDGAKQAPSRNER